MSENYINGETKLAALDHQVLLGKMFCRGVLHYNQHNIIEGSWQHLSSIVLRSNNQKSSNFLYKVFAKQRVVRHLNYSK